jgi:hypothetical protein
MAEPRELDEPDLKGAIESLKSVLIAPQTLEAWAVQRRVFALTHRRLLIGATSARRIALTRGVIGGFDLTAILWQDLEEVTLSVGLLARAARACVWAARRISPRTVPPGRGVCSSPDCASRRRSTASVSRRLTSSPACMDGIPTEL